MYDPTKLTTSRGGLSPFSPFFPHGSQTGASLPATSSVIVVVLLSDGGSVTKIMGVKGSVKKTIYLPFFYFYCVDTMHTATNRVKSMVSRRPLNPEFKPLIGRD